MSRGRTCAAAAAALALVVAAGPARPADAPPPEMRLVPGGRYTPFFPVKDEPATPVAPFLLDALPVTNAEFQDFVRAEPAWRRSRAAPLFVDDAYLRHWKGDLELGPEAPPGAPVSFVSWFAADAYCRARGKRLPTEAEWELAAAPEAESGASRAETERRILAFYARPRSALPQAGSTPANAFGVRDLHGVIWEWVEDANATFAAQDGRGDRDRALAEICGGGAVGAADTRSYTTFMRIAFRSSLEATFALHHLGFRCARSPA